MPMVRAGAATAQSISGARDEQVRASMAKRVIRNVASRSFGVIVFDPDRRAEYADHLVHPLYAAERGLVDDVIDPAQTRAAVARGLAMLHKKRRLAPQRKHGNAPI